MNPNLEQFIKENRSKFDFEAPNAGHLERFKSKLNPGSNKKSGIKIIQMIPWLIAAASVVLLVTVWMGNINTQKGLELADVSPKMQETQTYFEATIRNEIKKIDQAKTPENQEIINDGFEQLKKLEDNYQELMVELKESGENKRVIFAMITNFQQRVGVLQTILTQLEELEEINQNKMV